MVINEEDIRTAVMDMTDGIAPPAPVITAVCQRMELMLREDMTNEEEELYSGNIHYAAALMILRDMTAADTSPSEIKAGDVSMKNNVSDERINTLLQETMDVIAPVIKAGKSVFRAVKWGDRP